MKKILYITLAVLMTVGLSASAQAPKKQLYSLDWNIALPLGGLKDFVNDASVRGGNFNVQVLVTDNIAVGGTFGWNNYYELRDRASYQIRPGFAATATTYRYAYSMPLMANGYYHFMPDGMVQPYAGLGIGAMYATQHTLIQDLDFWNEGWGFLVMPEVGVFVPFGENAPFGAKVSAAYQFATNSFTALGEKHNNMQNINFNIGLVWVIK